VVVARMYIRVVTLRVFRLDDGFMVAAMVSYHGTCTRGLSLIPNDSCVVLLVALSSFT
jgi:hypothetical protein